MLVSSIVSMSPENRRNIEAAIQDSIRSEEALLKGEWGREWSSHTKTVWLENSRKARKLLENSLVSTAPRREPEYINRVQGQEWTRQLRDNRIVARTPLTEAEMAPTHPFVHKLAKLRLKLFKR
jgi:hypothetical protein